MTREDRAYNFVAAAIDNHLANKSTKKMVEKSKEANRHIKKGNFHKAELDRRKSEKFRMRALNRAKYNQEKLVDITYKHNDGEQIRHENKVRAIEKLK